MDISKVQFLNKKQMSFLGENSAAMVDKQILKALKDSDQKILRKYELSVSFKKVLLITY